MEQHVLEALKKSIEHWKDNLKAENPNDINLSVSACALCGLFFAKGCAGCPVSHNTLASHCCNTPYYDVLDALKEWIHAVDDNINPISCYRFEAQTKKAMQRELNFLLSLLPKENGNEDDDKETPQP